MIKEKDKMTVDKRKREKVGKDKRGEEREEGSLPHSRSPSYPYLFPPFTRHLLFSLSSFSHFSCVNLFFISSIVISSVLKFCFSSTSWCICHFDTPS